MLDIYGRIIDNDHIDKNLVDPTDKVKQAHSAADLIELLKLNDPNQFDSDSKSKNFSAKELADSLESDKDVVTIFDGDKVKGLKGKVDALTKAIEENGE